MTRKEIFELQEQIAGFSDQLAFKQLFEHYYYRLFQFAASIVKDKEIAEEIVEDLFIRLWDKRFTLHNISNLDVYLYVAIRNHGFNHVSRRAPLKTIDPDQLDVICGELVPTPEDLMVASELLQQVNRAVHQLPPRARIVYKLVKEDGLSYKEVAKVLGISPRTVENHIAAAIKKITASLQVDFSAVRSGAPLAAVR